MSNNNKNSNTQNYIDDFNLLNFEVNETPNFKKISLDRNL